MDLNSIKQTETWNLYEQGVSFCRMMSMYRDTDLNYRMYNGDQWQGLKIKGVEKIQLNIIKPIIRYKTGVVLSNLYAINYSSENFESRDFRRAAAKICKLLNKKAASIWEKDYMDMKLRLVVKDAAINDMGAIYVHYSEDTGLPVNEIIDKNDIYFGNENDSDIESQPYIIIKQRMSVVGARTFAKANGVSDEELEMIMGDMDNIEEAGEAAKYEKDNMCTVLTKFYKENGTVHFSMATRTVDIKRDCDTQLKYYPVAIIVWEEKKGSARGEGEVRQLIPNQLEINKTAMRRAITVKHTAFPQKIVNIDKINNKDALEKSGGLIKVSGGNTTEDVSKMFAYVQPAQMSTDVEKLQNELIQTTRELAGAGDIATGQINPESASGRAILAVQQASQQPLTEHLQYTKTFVECLARIWLDMLTVNNDNIDLEDEIKDATGEDTVQLIKVPRVVLEKLQAAVKVDITPKGAFDKYAQEQSLENLLTGGWFSAQKIPELENYISVLEDDANMPKQKVEEMIEKFKADQLKIAQMNAKAQMMRQRATQFINADIDTQAGQLLNAQRQMQAGQLTAAQ
ncbi:MAG: hypothetical protein IJV71_12140 [Lachnospiraceae bacterium]|nr:hypothetical protein [Lachnospiraceae bacterium]